VRSGTLPLHDLTAPVRAELERIGRELREDLAPEDPDLVPLVDLAAAYRGKQLRPALVCLSGRLLGRVTDAHIAVAKVVELLHTATLVHDDVLDGGAIRRQMPTVNSLYGSEVPVLLGDYIYARAFHLSVQLDDPTCSRVLAEVTRRICQGEIVQILHRFDFAFGEREYFRVITEKTALLYGAACRLGGHYAGGARPQLDALEQFGVELGVAFQIVDDCLDLGGEEAVVGKSLGTDLGKGKLTLPLLYLMRDPAGAAVLRELMESEQAEGAKLRSLRESLPLTEALGQAQSEAERHVRLALTSLERLPKNAAREAMAGMAEYVLARKL
jgi:octaprenyl-diphosphate synthase